jgi:putative transposase
MLGFKSFRSAQVTGIELMHMIRKGQLRRKAKWRPAQAFLLALMVLFVDMVPIR